ncbi:hypothetical protein KEM56_000439 [Ascosphaera pollenicola]|nr:hypothetical protein KEM56_000439 [Ascosphaera pollenicola]
MDPIFESGQPVTPEEYLQLREVMFEWADSYDTKDWDRLARVVAPYLKYVGVSDMTEFDEEYLHKDTYLALVSWPGFLGDPLVKTQHLIGLSKFRKISSTEAIGYHQIRAAHQRYTDETRTTVKENGHGHALVRTKYRKVGGGMWPWSSGGEWKWAGIETNIRWNEGPFENIFQFEKNGNFIEWMKFWRQGGEKSQQALN